MSSDSLYRSIYKDLKKKIIDGVYKIDDCLPTEEELKIFKKPHHH